ncbi:hypothetical protein DBV15_02248 [Temnothorax longispinosus]|uniref:Uncharacterized protein n=1 Tax=Temnothorax longispinosus TaxID=300112 RepID=A0A4S2KTW4_9HYME|nr:hypothetical protein DBV15_02248 [Temnothorax longispinosus]
MLECWRLEAGGARSPEPGGLEVTQTRETSTPPHAARARADVLAGRPSVGALRSAGSAPTAPGTRQTALGARDPRSRLSPVPRPVSRLPPSERLILADLAHPEFLNSHFSCDLRPETGEMPISRLATRMSEFRLIFHGIIIASFTIAIVCCKF